MGVRALSGADKAMQHRFGVLRPPRSEKQEVAGWLSPCFLDAQVSDRFLCEGLPKSSMELECQTLTLSTQFMVQILSNPIASLCPSEASQALSTSAGGWGFKEWPTVTASLQTRRMQNVCFSARHALIPFLPSQSGQQGIHPRRLN